MAQTWRAASCLRSPRAAPHGKPGDRLWVREAWAYVGPGSGSDLPSYVIEREASNCWYRATCAHATKWTPAIHMFRWASRITLEVSGVRVERLQEFSAEDAEAEGVKCDHSAWTFVDHYRALWEQINGAGSWDLTCGSSSSSG